MMIIESTVNKDKEKKITTYTFSVDHDVFVANYFSGTSSQMEIIHNGSLLGRINNHKIKSEYVVNQDTNPVRISAWIFKGHFFEKKGIGIEVNGNPIQHTLADPEPHIQNGKLGLYIILFIFGLKFIATYHHTYKEYTSHIVAGMDSAIYFVMFLIVLLVAKRYQTWTKISIITGLFLAFSELMFDYMLLLFSGMISTNNMILAILIRIYAIYVLFNALKWREKFVKG